MGRKKQRLRLMMFTVLYTVCRVSTEGTTRLPLEDITWVGGISLAGRKKRSDGDDSGPLGELEPRCLASFMVIAAHSLSSDTINRVFTTQLNVFLRVRFQSFFISELNILIGLSVSHSKEVFMFVFK